MARKVLTQFRRDTAANWTAANPTLAAGEPGFETDTLKAKIGDGATAWNTLAYIGGGSGTISRLTSTGATITVTNPTGPTANVDLPASGVTAATYGDSTHVGQFTVSADGIITAASAIGISGLAGTGLNKLVTVTRATTGALDTGANAIPVGHGSLIVMCWCRTAAAATTESYTLTLNGDVGAHYDDYHWQTSGGTQSSGAQTAGTSWNGSGLLTGNGAVAGTVSPVIIFFPGYDDTNWNKSGLLYMGTPQGQRSAFLSVSFRSTAAINQITLDTASHLLTNSNMVVYGTE